MNMKRPWGVENNGSKIVRSFSMALIDFDRLIIDRFLYISPSLRMCFKPQTSPESHLFFKVPLPSRNQSHRRTV